MTTHTHFVPSLKHLLVFSLVLLGSSLWMSSKVQADELWLFWAKSNEQNTQSIDHSLWKNNLNRYLKADHPSGVNLYAYSDVTEQDKAHLATYLKQMSDIDPREYAKAEQKAYWINLYNALTVELILDHYPTTSIRKLGSSFFSFGPWDDHVITVANQALTLNDIEHRILRPIWKDPRIHYAVNCASLSCPNLAADAYTSANMESLLEQGAKDYVNHVRGVKWKESGLMLSKIYHWYQRDFGKDEQEMIQHLIQYASPELARTLADFDPENHDIDYRYDWSLNDLSPK